MEEFQGKKKVEAEDSMLTDWRLQFMPSATAPSRWVKVRGVIIQPVVISRRPAIKVDLNSVTLHISYSGHTHQDGVSLVHHLQPLPHYETHRWSLKQAHSRK